MKLHRHETQVTEQKSRKQRPNDKNSWKMHQNLKEADNTTKKQKKQKLSKSKEKYNKTALYMHT